MKAKEATIGRLINGFTCSIAFRSSRSKKRLEKHQREIFALEWRKIPLRIFFIGTRSFFSPLINAIFFHLKRLYGLTVKLTGKFLRR